MAKPLTLKDVLYALEYGGKELVRWPSSKVGTPAVWSLEPGSLSGTKVAGRIADEARAAGNLTSTTGKYGETRYAWRRAA